MPTPSSEQLQRQNTIRELLKRGPIETQKTLVAELRTRGHIATQSSVSRDLKELGAIKTDQGYELPGAIQQPSDVLSAIGSFVRDVRPAGPNLLVIRTAIGAAQRVALALDRSNWPEMVGNIGGDDTVFVATESGNHQKILVAKIDRAINGTATA